MVYASFIVTLVFVPLLTLGGVAGKLFAPLGLAYILAILASLLVALTVTPALSHLLLTSKRLATTEAPLIRHLKTGYQRTLRAIERGPAVVLAGVAVALVATLAVLPLLGGEFLPHLKEGHYIIHMSAVPGTAEGETLRLGTRVTAAVLKIPGVKSVAQWVGRAQNGADTFGVHYSESEVELEAQSGKEQDRILASIRKLLSGDDGDDDHSDEQREGATRRFLGVDFTVNTFLTERIEETVSGYTAPLVVQVFGSSLDLIDRDAQSVVRALAQVKGAREIQLQAQPGNPQLTLRLRPDRLTEYGFAQADVLEAIAAASAGVRVGQVYQNSRPIPLTLTVDFADPGTPGVRGHPDELGRLLVSNEARKFVRLDRLAELEPGNGRYKILREGGKRVQGVTATIVQRDYHDFVAEVQGKLAGIRLAPATISSCRAPPSCATKRVAN